MYLCKPIQTSIEVTQSLFFFQQSCAGCVPICTLSCLLPGVARKLFIATNTYLKGQNEQLSVAQNVEVDFCSYCFPLQHKTHHGSDETSCCLWGCTLTPSFAS